MARSIEETRKAKREFMARKRAADPEGSRRYHRERHHKNRDRNCAKMRDYYARRFFWGRAMKLRGEDRAKTADLASLWKMQRGRCALTGRRLTRTTAHLDHITAKARGGSDCIGNLRWVCIDANLAKRDLNDAEFATLCSDVMHWIGERIQAVEGIAMAHSATAAGGGA